MDIHLLYAAIIGYLLGSLPFGYLVARAKGVNIFQVGSKSSGATNVRRVLGRGPGALVLLLDAAKGAAAASVVRVFDGDWHILGLAGLLGALVGHSFSCFTKFRGGKGVATAAGGFLVLFPIGVLVAAVVWGVSLAITRYVSLASMLAGVALTASAWFLHTSLLMLVACAAVMLFVIIRHRANISRLISGTENKVGSKKDQPDAP